MSDAISGVSYFLVPCFLAGLVDLVPTKLEMEGGKVLADGKGRDRK
jgi:hypothetical protein